MRVYVGLCAGLLLLAGCDRASKPPVAATESAAAPAAATDAAEAAIDAPKETHDYSMGAKSALGRPARASEQAEVAAFLASDRSSYVTGTVIPVDGGWTARVA
ncbi:MAG: SDR family oxidoreductase [Novosphingobium sp.]|nr:SDR family oxidoreductase [Novosphingobium sp.]